MLMAASSLILANNHNNKKDLILNQNRIFFYLLLFSFPSCSKNDKFDGEYGVEITHFYRFVPANELEIPATEFDYYFSVVDQNNESGSLDMIHYLLITDSDTGESYVLANNDESESLSNDWVTVSVAGDRKHLRVQISKNEQSYTREVTISIYSAFQVAYSDLTIKQLPPAQP